MTSNRAKRGRQRDKGSARLRQLREVRSKGVEDGTPPGRQHPRWCEANHHQAMVDYDRDCPVCMAELTGDQH